MLKCHKLEKEKKGSGLDQRLNNYKSNPAPFLKVGVQYFGCFGSCAPCHTATIQTTSPLIL
jgi:hypothetical protein